MQERTDSFGYWLRRRRKALDLTQEALAERVSCSGFSVRKIEADERRPSRHLAERLATALAIPADERRDFLDAARALGATRRLRLDALPLAAAARATAAAATASSTPSAAAAAGDAAPFVGRAAEFALLSGLVAQLGAGRGFTVLVEGEPGIGKSRLLLEVERHARSLGLPTLVTHCYEIERATPYQPVLDLVSRALDVVPDFALRTLAPVSLAELAALVPEITERAPGLPALSNDFPAARQARLPRAVDQLFEATRGGRPLILMVDDIQWADDASAQVLLYLARHAAERPVGVVFTSRDEELGSNEHFAQWAESLRRDAGARRLLLAPLAAADTAALVAALAASSPGATGLAERLHLETAGNPFFLISILQSLSAGETQLDAGAGAAAPQAALLPDALRAAVRVRLAHVPKALRPVLEIAAVLGRGFDFDTLLEVTGQAEAQLLDAVEALVKRRLWREEAEGGVYDFSHGKLREVVYRDLGGARRRLLHQRVAEALERRGEGPLRADAPLHEHEREAQLAEHFERAQVWAKALHYLVRAGQRSQVLFALRDALHWFDRAAALCTAQPQAFDAAQRLRVHALRGAARAQAGQTQGAVADLRTVVDAARAAGDRAATRDALVQLGMAYRRADAYDEATACLSEALAESRAMNDDHHAADTLYHLGTVAWSRGLNDQATGFHEQAVQLCERMGFADLVAVQAWHGRGEAHFANAEPAPAIDAYTRSLVLARGIGDKSYECENLMMIGYACVGSRGLGDYPRASANFEAALGIAQAVDLQWHIGPTLLGLDHVRACTGRYGEAWFRMGETLRWLGSLQQVRYQLIGHDLLGHLLLDLGLNERALEQLERGRALARASGILFWRATLDTQVALAQARLGHAPDLAALHATLEQTRASAERYLTVRCLDGLAEISLAAGDASACRRYADDLLAIAEANGLRELEASARRWRGEAALAEKAYAPAQAELTRAAALADATGRVRLQLDTHAALARLHAAQGQPDAAQRHRERAMALRQAIEASLVGSGLEARLLCPG